MKIYLKGNYPHHFTHLEVYKCKVDTKNVLVNVHGLYGQSGDKGSRSKFLGNQILLKELANVVHISTSRDWNAYDQEDRDKSVKAFENKTFAQERQDIADALELLIANSKDLFEVSNIKFWIVANSVGGTIVSSLHEYFKYVDKLVLCGSGTGSSNPKKPILSTYPSKDYILNSTKNYANDVLLLQGSEDAVVPLFSQEELIKSFTSAKLNKIVVIEGANHQFTSIFGKHRGRAIQLYSERIINFLIN